MKGAKNSCQTKEKNICHCGRQQVGHVVESQFQFGASGQNRPQTPLLPQTPPKLNTSHLLPPHSVAFCFTSLLQNHWLLPCHRWNYVAMVF